MALWDGNLALNRAEPSTTRWLFQKKKNISDPISSNWAQSDRNWLKSNRSKCLTARPTVAADVTQALHPQHHHQEEEEEEDEEEEHLE